MGPHRLPWEGAVLPSAPQQHGDRPTTMSRGTPADALHVRARNLWASVARRPRGADAALTVAVFVTSLFLMLGPFEGEAPGDLPFAALFLLAVACGALYWRRTEPLGVLGLTLVATLLAAAIGYRDLAGGYAVLVALYSAGRYVDDERWSYVGLAGSFSVCVGFPYLIGAITAVAVGFGLVVLSAVWYVGRRLRTREEDAEERRREQAADADRAVQAERTRIARELHDVVAHRVSLMTVQAGAAKTVALDDPQAALQAMEAVEHAGRQALDELRHLLGVLRPTGDEGSLVPQPGLADVPRLVDQFRAAGLDVSLQMADLPRGLPTRVDLSGYRIVQESLTNVLKHAGPKARTEVRVSAADGAVDIEVSDRGHAAAGLPGSGYGIVGMRERALLLGGSLTAGPQIDGGFRVAAHLPVGGAGT